MPSPETHLRIGRSHITPAGHHLHINSRSTHIPLLTRAASEYARPHVPPNLALILAWTYGAVNSRSTHIPLLTRAATEHARLHVPPNLALILAWTYGAVARALGSLVKSNPTVSITFRSQFLSPRDRFQYIPTRERTNEVTPCHNAHMV